MSLFICPICGDKLDKNKGIYNCPSGHCYDIASEGYVNLLPANKKHSKVPGDDKNMVLARNRFLSGDYYAPLRKELIKLFLRLTPDYPALLDSGCGEGYYTQGILESLKVVGKSPRVAGIDISKEAVRLAAKKSKDAEFAVASAYHLPIAEDSIDFVLNCFSPLCESEFRRVLRREGYFVYVVPAPRHLWEMKCAVYDTPYENERFRASYEGFTLKETVEVQEKVILNDKQAVTDLFTMTPYFWKTSQEGIERLKKLDVLQTEIAFDVHVYQKR